MKKNILLILIILLSAGNIFAQKSNFNKMIIFPLKNINCPKKISTRANYSLKKYLKKIGYIKLISNRKLLSPYKKGKRRVNCYNKKCTVKTGKKNEVHRAVYGSIKKERIKTLSGMGKSGGNRYLLKVNENDYYIISINIVDIENGKILEKYNRKIKAKQIVGTIKNIVNDMEQYFPERRVKSSNFFKDVKFNLNVSGAFYLPIGSFEKVTNMSFGLMIKPELKNLLFQNSVVQLNTGLNYYTSDNEDINLFFNIPFAFQFGALQTLLWKKA